MWNMNFTVPTFVLVLIIAGAFFGRRRLPVRINRIFAGLILTDFATMAFDYLSTRMDEMAGAFPDPALWLANYLFFGFFIARGFYFFRFALALVDIRRDQARAAGFKALYVAEQVFLLVGSLTGWVFSIHDGAYVGGPLYPFVNIQLAVWIVAALLMTASDVEALRARKVGVHLYLAILLLGVIVRALMPHVVIMNLFCLFAIQVIYLLYLNPDQYLDDATTLFNEKGWKLVIDEAFTHPEFCLVGFGVSGYMELRQTRGAHQVDRALSEVGVWVRREWPGLSTFYLGDGLFALSSTRPFDQKQTLEAIERRFEEPWALGGGSCYLDVNELVMKPGVMAEADSIGRADVFKDVVYTAFRSLHESVGHGLIDVDEGLIARHARIAEVRALLNGALESDGLEMFLQPIVSTATGMAEGAEALCRLPDGEGGHVFPDEFIPLALDEGDIGRLGQQMFGKACAFMARPDVRASSLAWVNVNVAPEQFKDPHLLDDFLEVLGRFGVTPAEVHLEVTEETMIDRSLLHEAMARFRERGFVFSMDDFGSSYSNMIRLQQNHFSTVKIDRDFTWSYFHKKTALLPDIIHTCHDLGMKVVTEGVETAEMVEGVTEIGADYIQGYYYSKPIPADDFAARFLVLEKEHA